MKKLYWLALLGVLFLCGTGLALAQQPTGARGDEIVSPRNQYYGETDLLLSAVSPLPVNLLGIPPQAFTITEPPQTPAEAAPETWQNMVVQSFRDDNWEIYSAQNVTGEKSDDQVKRLTYHLAYDGQPNFNPGCTSIVFVSDRDGNTEIYKMNADGSQTTRLTWNSASDYQPEWAYDSSQIAFVSTRDGNAEIYLMNSSGGSQRRLTYSPENEFSPTLSPDGKRIAWIRVVSDELGVIVVANVDGSNQQTLGGPLRFVSDLTWSPTSSRLAFDYDADGNGWNNLGMIGVNGAGFTRLTHAWGAMDMVAGSWSVTEEFIYFSQIEYIMYDGNYYISNAHIAKYRVSSGGIDGNYIIRNRYDFYPSVRSSDVIAPVSRMRLLPSYSRANGIVLDWIASDSGSSGLDYSKIEYRAGTSGEWKTAVGVPYGQCRPPSGCQMLFADTPGQILYFRSAAQDYAGNQEPTHPGNGDTFTSLFTWLLQGKVTDLRGNSVPLAPLSINPAGFSPQTSSETGQFDAYLTTNGPVSLAAGPKPGYGTFPPSELTVTSDSTTHSYLPPQTNWIQNGGFEAPSLMDGWSLNDKASRAQEGHTGLASAQLGMACSIPCLAQERPLAGDVGESYRDSFIKADSFGNIHILYSFNRYVVINAQGQSSTSVLVGGLPALQNTFHRPALDIDSQGNMHVVAGRRYFSKPAGGDWRDPLELPVLSSAGIAVNRQGIVLLAYATSDGIYYRARSAGQWNASTQLNNYSNASISLATDSDGNFYLLVSGFDSGTYMASFTPGGQLATGGNNSWSGANRPSSGIQLVAGANNTLHVLYHVGEMGKEYFAYVSRSSQGVWSAPIQITDKFTDADLAVDADGTVHIFGAYNGSITYYRKTASETGFQRYSTFPGASAGVLACTSDPSGGLHLIWTHSNSLAYRSPLRWVGSPVATIATNFAIPAEAHHPTLSFMYRMDSYPNTQPVFRVSITQGLTETTTTQVLTTNQDTGWRLAWVDLSPWKSQAVSVTFELQAAEGSLPTNIWIDSISAGEWWTPVISDVTPTHFDFGTSDWITITGDNLPLTPTIKVGSTLLENIIHIDEHTLLAQLNSSIPVGKHSVQVISPEGHTGIKPSILQIGSFIYLPIMLR
jgi:TolB protein